jgi:mannose-6-phosphate isomerase-like protein (cupin superfamily)
MPNPVAPFVVLPGDGTPIQLPLGGSNLLKAHTRNTNGSFTMIQCDVPPKQGPALHIHTREDELWYILEGDFRFKTGDAMLGAPQGACIFGPRGIPHSFQNVGDTPGRLLAIYAPSGVERFFEQYAELLPGPVDPKAFAAIADTNWLEFIGPPLAVSDPL